MISGLNASMALATRTASQARTAMDRAAREIATGQKVSSVKDDGAAWTRAAGLKSQQVDWQNTKRNADWNVASVGFQLSGSETLEAPMRDVRAALLRLTEPGLSATTRNALLQEASQAWNLTGNAWTQNTNGLLGDATGVQDAQLRLADGTVLVSRGWLGHPGQFGTQSTIGSIQLNQNGAGEVRRDVLTELLVIPDTAAAASALAFIDSVMPSWRNEVAGQAASVRTAERFGAIAERSIDRLDVQRGALTDADFGKSSTALRQSETRQQLALDTVRTAITAYGNMATGLLGNVQRTQRGIMA
jgi:flagellin